MTPPGVAGHNRPHRTASCPAILMGAGLAARKSPDETRTGNGRRFAGAVGCASRSLGILVSTVARRDIAGARAVRPGYGPPPGRSAWQAFWAALNRGELWSMPVPVKLKPIWWLFSKGSGKFAMPCERMHSATFSKAFMPA